MLLKVLLTRPEVAARLRLKESTLRLWAANGTGPKFVRLGLSDKSPVRFLEDEVDRYLADPEAYERERLSERLASFNTTPPESPDSRA